MTYLPTQHAGDRTGNPVDGTAGRRSNSGKGLLAAWPLVAAVALVALATTGGRPSTAPDPLTNTGADRAANDSGPAFDGRGKWSGYAR